MTWALPAKGYSQRRVCALVEAVMRKWLKENPERWHERCRILAYSALEEMCQVRQP